MVVRNHRRCALIRVAPSYKYNHVTTATTPIELAIHSKRRVLMTNKETEVPQNGKLYFVCDVD